jgi:uncharacterized protein YidB (DUF937 family)
MSLDQILGSVLGKGGSSQAIMSAAMGLLNSRGGGSLGNLLGAFSGAGMEDKAQSWVGTGPNQSLSGAEVKEALGPDVHQVAQQAGVSDDEAASTLAQVIPGVVDEATPNGKVENDSLQDLVGGLMAQLGR